MTTRVHIVNFGPQVVDVKLKNPQTGEALSSQSPSLGTQQSTDVYVHDTQSVEVIESKPKTEGA